MNKRATEYHHAASDAIAMKNLLKKLRPFIFGGRQVSQRDALVRDFIARQTPGSSLLDAGAGPQRFKRYCAHLHYISQDFGQYLGGDDFAGEPLKEWDSRSCDILSDISAIPLSDNSIDSIICVEVFEHLPRPADALKEFSRLLRTGGRLLVTAPFNSQYHQVPYFFYSGFSSEFYRTYAAEFGLEIVRIVPIGDYYESIAQELLRLPFLKSAIVLKLAIVLLIVPAYLCVYMMHLLRVPSPVSPLDYVVEIRKSEIKSCP